MNNETILFPLCGITYGHVLDMSSKVPSQRVAAKKLGICERQFYNVIKSKGLTYLFDNKKCRSRCVTKGQVIEVAGEGYTRIDTAYILGIAPSYLKDLIKLWGIADSFTLRGGKAAYISRVGYVGRD